MSEEIVNRVANSALITVDLEEFYPEGPRMTVDLSQWLDQGFILKEKEFRQALDHFDWSPYQGAYVNLICSTDAILPGWAFMLVGLKLSGIAEAVAQGSGQELERSLYQSIISTIDPDPYRDKPVIIKGCSHKPVPEEAYLMLANHLQPVARSIMYGEACSSVPLYKRKKS
ncbi:DUF2480 family protein [Aureitalea marina]|uniref:DUF2480 family protein n=1 Tax=Aureitalea marina TaxID=930804 RepID=A0A2S7KSL7_9FLAO|nr:DUF2480 family protein [Aureitalea marina]PQB05622.1 hypothetical protein BST85_12480 [Aureitalea marina]